MQEQRYEHREPRYGYMLGHRSGVILQRNRTPSSANPQLLTSIGMWGAVADVDPDTGYIYVMPCLVNKLVRIVFYKASAPHIFDFYQTGSYIPVPAGTVKYGINVDAGDPLIKRLAQKENMNTDLVNRVTADFIYGMRRCMPFCKNLVKKYARESDQMFMRATLNGTLSLHGDDFNFIWRRGFDSSFLFTVNRYSHKDAVYTEYFRGVFSKTDCTFDYGRRKCTPKISAYDRYRDILDGWEDEYDLVRLGTPRTPVRDMSIRPVMQVWVAGSKTVCNYLGGLYWHTEVDVDEGEIVNLGNPSDASKDIIKKYHFAYQQNIKDQNNADNYIFIRIISAIQRMPSYTSSGVTDILATATLDAEDPFARPHRNYIWAAGATVSTSSFAGTTATQDEETPYGITDKGDSAGDKFFKDIGSLNNRRWYPLCRDRWGDTALWISLDGFVDPATGADIEPAYRKTYDLRDSFTIADALATLLRKVDPSLTHEATEEYSRFLYARENPLGQYIPPIMPCITQRTNVLKGNYDQAAQKCPVTLKGLLDMLRDVFRCYWFIDGGRLRIEHVSFFMNAGSYGAPGAGPVQFDLTALTDRFNRRPAEYFQTTVSFDQEGPEVPREYTLNWGEESSYVFDDVHIVLKSDNVDRKKSEEITVSDFSADVDRMLLQPDDFSDEGLALLCQMVEYETSDRPVDGQSSEIKGSKYLSGFLYSLYNGGYVENTNGTITLNKITASGGVEIKPYRKTGSTDYKMYEKTNISKTGKCDYVGTNNINDYGRQLFMKEYPVTGLDFIKIKYPNCATDKRVGFFKVSDFNTYSAECLGWASQVPNDSLIQVPNDANRLLLEMDVMMTYTDIQKIGVIGDSDIAALPGFISGEPTVYTGDYETETIITRKFTGMRVPSTVTALKDEYGKCFTPTVQNWYASLARSALEFYKYGLPAARYSVDKACQLDFNTPAGYVKKIASQGLRFPADEDPDPDGAVRTGLGDGTIDGMEVDLDSRTVSATVVYDPEKITAV